MLQFGPRGAYKRSVPASLERFTCRRIQVPSLPCVWWQPSEWSSFPQKCRLAKSPELVPARLVLEGAAPRLLIFYPPQSPCVACNVIGIVGNLRGLPTASQNPKMGSLSSRGAHLKCSKNTWGGEPQLSPQMPGADDAWHYLFKCSTACQKCLSDWLPRISLAILPGGKWEV